MKSQMGLWQSMIVVVILCICPKFSLGQELVVDLSKEISSDPGSFYTLGDKLLFTARNGIYDPQLFSYSRQDGAVPYPHPEYFGSSISSYAEYKGKLYFGNAEGLWETDGINPYKKYPFGLDNPRVHGDANHLVVYEDLLYFIGSSILWKFDGVNEPDTVQSFHTNGWSARDLSVFNDSLIFLAEYSVTDYSDRLTLWTMGSDNIPRAPLIDSPIYEVYSMANLGESLILSEYPNFDDTPVWIYDGMTAPEKFTAPGEPIRRYRPDHLQIGEWLYYGSAERDEAQEIWRISASGEGIERVAELPVHCCDGRPSDLVELGGDLYFLASDEGG